MSAMPRSILDERPQPATLALAHEHAQYRSDIDGLRAIAILSVLVFHAEPSLLTGGFVGVDVFFVISGFLISGIILRALARGRFSILDFYSRRVKRIFPALIAMLLGVWMFGWLLLLPSEYEQLGKHIATGGGFILNISLFQDTREYFGAINSPLVHLWSLGVEEQFYLLWPVLLLLTAKLGRGQFFVVALLGIASFVANVALVSSHPLAAFYLPVCRLWELALGGTLAHVHLRGAEGLLPSSLSHRAWPRPSRHFLGWLGLLLIIVSCAYLNPHMAFPGWWALGPCGGAALIIAAGPQSWVNRYLLGHPVMVFIGLISYPLYLWHWPLLSFAHTADWREFTWPVKILAIATSIALAYLTYRYLERPIRSSPRSRPLAVGLCAVMCACVTVGCLVLSGWAPARPLPDSVSRVVQASDEGYPYPDEEGFLRVGQGTHEVLFIGDSTMGQYHGSVAKFLAEHPELSRVGVFAWKAGCAPDVGMSLVDPPACQALIDQALEYAKRPSVDTVVIGFCWYAYFMGILEDDHVGEPAPLVPDTGRVLDNIEHMVAGLVQSGKRVEIILQTPLDPGFDPRQMIRRSVSPPGFQITPAYADRATITRTFEPFVSRLRDIALRTGASTIDPMESLCDAHICSSVNAAGEPIYRDSFHLRKDYVRDHVHYLDAVFTNPALVSKVDGPT
jgi:peptidoglycan/LPS O-acetylase OafA/YrhL